MHLYKRQARKDKHSTRHTKAKHGQAYGRGSYHANHCAQLASWRGASIRQIMLIMYVLGQLSGITPLPVIYFNHYVLSVMALSQD
jgi:hypothetical protein